MALAAVISASVASADGRWGGALYGLAEVSFGLMDLVWGGYDYDFFSPVIRTGQFDQMLIRPLPLPLQILTSEFALRRLGRVAQGVGVFALGCRLTGVEWTLAKAAYLPVVIVSAMAFFGALYVVGSTVCFWTVERLEVFNLFTYGGAEMLSYPMHIDHRWLTRFFTFVVPAAVQVYYPALYFLDKPDPWGCRGSCRPGAGDGLWVSGAVVCLLGLWSEALPEYRDVRLATEAQRHRGEKTVSAPLCLCG